MKRILLTGLVVSLSACAGRRLPRAGTPPPPVGTVQQGLASWYGLEEKGRPTASGEIMDPERFTAAHNSFPFGTIVRVDDLDSGRSVVVTINDRGPFVTGRIIDLSYASAKALGMIGKGVARVRIQVIGEGAEPSEATPYAWRVQVGAFQEEERAERLAESFRRRRYEPVLVHPQRQRGRTLFKVWIGRFNLRAEADALAQGLRRKGQPAIVISTKANP